MCFFFRFVVAQVACGQRNTFAIRPEGANTIESWRSNMGNTVNTLPKKFQNIITLQTNGWCIDSALRLICLDRMKQRSRTVLFFFFRSGTLPRGRRLHCIKLGTASKQRHCMQTAFRNFFCVHMSVHMQTHCGSHLRVNKTQGFFQMAFC